MTRAQSIEALVMATGDPNVERWDHVALMDWAARTRARAIEVSSKMRRRADLICIRSRTPEEQAELIALDRWVDEIPTRTGRDAAAMELIRHGAALIESQNRPGGMGGGVLPPGQVERTLHPPGPPPDGHDIQTCPICSSGAGPET